MSEQNEAISTDGVSLYVRDHTGKDHELEAVEGWRVMEIIREHGLDIKGTCDGACECSTCHVLVDDRWMAKLHPISEDEEDLLNELPEVYDNSRLSCQIIWSDRLNGMKVTLAPKD